MGEQQYNVNMQFKDSYTKAYGSVCSVGNCRFYRLF